MDVSIFKKEAFVAELLARLKYRLSVTEESEKAFARRMGSSDALFKNLANGSMPAADRLSVLLEEIGETVFLGKEPVIDSLSPVTSVMVAGTEYASIALHEAWLSAGPGIDNGGTNIIDHLAFRRDWLRQMHINPKNCCLARVWGDSMFPTLSHGDMVLIDTSNTNLADCKLRAGARRRPAIWALLDAGEARIKRIEQPNANAVLLVSDNPEHPPELRTGHQLDQFKVIGKVIWWGHTNRE